MFAGNRSWAASALNYDYTIPGDPNQITKSGSATIPIGRTGLNLNACNGNTLCSQHNAA